MKLCNRCNILKPYTDFHKHAGHHDGYATFCKTCRQEIESPGVVERAQLYAAGKKRCFRCKAVKPFTEFHKQASSPDGYQSRCKVCRQELRYPDAEKNRQEKERLRKAKLRRCWRCGKLKPFSEFFNCKTYTDGKTHLCKHCHVAYQRERRIHNEECREAVNRQTRKWCRKNPDKRRATIERRRSRKKGADGSFSAKDIKQLRKAQKNTCIYCGLNPNCYGVLFTYHIDHIIPLSRGGSNDLDNLQLLCPHCNQSKLDKTHDEYLEWLRVHYDQ